MESLAVITAGMRRLLFLAPIVLIGCVPRSAPPEPEPQPRPAPAPRPAAPPPAPLASDWRDWPRTPGDWRYRNEGGGSVASYAAAGGAPSVTLRCDRAARRIALTRAGEGGAAMTVRTTSQTRALPARNGPQGVTAELAATDRLLDAMAYSRGRFTVEVPPMQPLALPAWAEVARVIEDCR